jgi:hypothetical protein
MSRSDWIILIYAFQSLANENPNDSIHANREFDSNEIHESDSQYETQSGQRISTWNGIKIDSIRVNRGCVSIEIE